MNLEYIHEAIFTMTIRGKTKLLHDGYEYTKTDARNGVTYWVCTKARNQYCRGKAKSRQIGLREMMTPYSDHNH